LVFAFDSDTAIMMAVSLSTRIAELSGQEPLARANRPAVRNAALFCAMAAILSSIAGLAYWDAGRESAVAMQDFAEEQATLAGALGAALRVRRAHSSESAPSRSRQIFAAETLAGIRSIERPQVLRLFQHRPGEAVLRSTDGREVRSPRVIEALDRGQSVVRIPRAEAAEFGLHSRTAMAGLSRVDAGEAGSWDIVAVATAERQRDRERWARGRLILSILMAAGLVTAFGGAAMRNQRKELTLEGELAIASLQQARDERLERASKAAVMGTLAMGVAHEISTPLGVIVARAEQLLKKVAADDRLAEGVRAIMAQTERIDQVMRGLLGLARGDAPSLERIDPGTLIANAVALVEHRFSRAGVQLTGKVEVALPSILGDPRLLEHAIANLLLNACDACNVEGTVVITARRDRGEIEVAVDDTGMGISLADVDRALEPFFTTKARQGGTGLGLAIAHEIVQNHRGRLAFSSLEPKGTRVAIRLPPAEGSARG
jgi:two-component system NtrC family sensor kinase